MQQVQRELVPGALCDSSPMAARLRRGTEDARPAPMRTDGET